MKEHLTNPPNWFTAASIGCSFLAIGQVLGRSATEASLATASILVVVAGLLDVADGYVARRFGRSTAVGAQLDSFADLVGFGVAPATLIWVWKLQHLGTAGLLVSTGYVIAAALRLARFNVEGSGPGWNLPGHVRGLTTTMSGGMLVTLVWLANSQLPGLAATPPSAVAVVALFFSVLMLSDLPLRSFKDIRSSSTSRTLLVAFGVPGLVMGLFHPSFLFGFCGLSYAVLGPLDAFIVSFRHGLGPSGAA